MLPAKPYWKHPAINFEEVLDFDGTAAPARTGDPQIHNLVL
jgi:hypothetical protein